MIWFCWKAINDYTEIIAHPYLYQTCRHHFWLQSVFEHRTRKPVTQDFPPWERLEVTDLSTHHLKKQGTNKEKWLHFTASERPALRQRRRQVFSTHHPWQNPSWHSFNIGSPLREWRPQPLGAPDTPLAWHAVPALAKHSVQRAQQRRGDGLLGGLVSGELGAGEGGIGTKATARKRMMFPREEWRGEIYLKLQITKKMYLLHHKKPSRLWLRNMLIK